MYDFSSGIYITQLRLEYRVVVDNGFDAAVCINAGKESIAVVVVNDCVSLQLRRMQTLTVRVRLSTEVDLTVDTAQSALPLVGGAPAALRANLGRCFRTCTASVLRRRLSGDTASNSGRPSTPAVDRRRRDNQQRDDVQQTQKDRLTLTQARPHRVSFTRESLSETTSAFYDDLLPVDYDAACIDN